MKRTLLAVLSFVVVALSVSCENTTVEEDMANYCECKKKAVAGQATEQECVQLMEEISTKYEFDPEAVHVIQEEIIKCNEELSQND